MQRAARDRHCGNVEAGSSASLLTLRCTVQPPIKFTRSESSLFRQILVGNQLFSALVYALWLSLALDLCCCAVYSESVVNGVSGGYLVAMLAEPFVSERFRD